MQGGDAKEKSESRIEGRVVIRCPSRSQSHKLLIGQRKSTFTLARVATQANITDIGPNLHLLEPVARDRYLQGAERFVCLAMN